MNALRHLSLSIVSLILLALAPLGTALAQVKVTAATPASTYQGTIGLDVIVDGSGFDSTAKATFLVSGTAEIGGITVRKTVVKGSKQLVATIDVADAAVIAKFDIVVALSDGRKGKGTTLFAVQSKTIDPCTTAAGFPAFIFAKVTGSYTTYVADRTGKCVRKLIDNVSSLHAAFSYPVKDDLGRSTNRGRIVWLAGKYYAMDFEVIGANIVGGATYLVADLGPSAGEGGRLSCCRMDLSVDGRSLFVPVVDLLQEGYVESIVRLRLPEALADLAGQLPLAETTIIRHRPRSSATSFLGARTTGDMDVNGAEDLLFVQLRDFDMNGTPHDQLVSVDLDPDLVDTNGRREITLLRDPVGGSGSAADVSSPSSDLVVTLDPTSMCQNAVVINGRTGTVLNEGTQWPGHTVAWAGGKILSRGFRSGCRSLDTIVQIDPTTGATLTLVSGVGAEGR
jgi:hypothetical protein